MKQGPQMNNSDEIDEHDLPTEPLPEVPDFASPAEATVPVPQPPGSPFPQQRVQGQQPPYPQYPQYPYVPPVPGEQTDSGTQPVRGSSLAYPTLLPLVLRGLLLRIPIPLCVGLFFVFVQLLLLVRFILRMINLPADGAWVGAIYAISSVFVLPFAAFFPQVTLSFTTIEVYTLLAILIYGLISRLLVRLLKLVFKPQTASQLYAPSASAQRTRP